MELLASLFMHIQKLEYLCILQEALKVPYMNPIFILFTLATSLPLFYSMTIYETIFQTTLAAAFNIPNQTYDSFYFYDYTWRRPISTISGEYYYRSLLKIGFFYVVPVFISELFSIVVTVVLASRIYRGDGETETSMSMKEMVVETFKKTRWDSAFITASYVHAFSACILLGLVWLVTNYFFFLSLGKIHFYGYFFGLFFASLGELGFYGYFFGFFSAMAILFLLKKYLEWSAEWNMGIVISILDGEYGAEALGKSAYFVKGSELRGFLLMLVFFLWGFVLRFSSLFFGWYEEERAVIVQVGLFCVGNVMKWVVCTVYFFDCEARVLEKKFDKDVGGDIENVDQEGVSKEKMEEGR